MVTPLTLTLNACNMFGLSAAAGPATTAMGASCSPKTMSHPTPSATFSAFAAGCGGGTGALCAGGVCAKPTAGHYCVYQSGTPTCPSSFPNGVVVYASVTSSYTCPGCSCVLTAPPSCTPTAAFYSDNTCGTPITSAALDGTSCDVFSGGPPTLVEMTSAGTPSGGACALSGSPTLSGSASGTSPVTICCAN
jgi:hypothetical protein